MIHRHLVIIKVSLLIVSCITRDTLSQSFDELVSSHCPSSISQSYIHDANQTMLWEAISTGKCFKLNSCKSKMHHNTNDYDTSTMDVCKNLVGNESYHYCIHNDTIAIELKHKACQWKYATYDDTIRSLRDKSILMIGDSRVRYLFVTTIYWLEHRTWPQSGRSDSYRSVANELYWRISKQETAAESREHWNRYYCDMESLMNGHLKIEGLRGIDNTPHNVRNGENWYYEWKEAGIRLSYNNLIENDISSKYPYYPSDYEAAINYGPMKIEQYLMDVVPMMNISHLIYQNGWGLVQPNNKGLDDSFHHLMDHLGIKVIYNTGFNGMFTDPNRFISINMTGIQLIDMKEFCESMLKQLKPTKFVMWDNLHYRSWAYFHMLQLMLTSL